MGNYAGNVLRRRIIQLVISCVLLWPSLLVRGLQQTFDRQTLDSFIGQHALKNASNRRTGRLYDVVLPANFSGMEASVVRFRSGSLWKRGANFSLFHIPPNILPVPFMRRMNIVFVNLGNWSSSYYNVPNYTLVAPVVGLLGYDADIIGPSSSHRRIDEFRLMKDRILVHFPNNNNRSSLAGMKCVRFGINGGTMEFSNVRVDGLCVARGQGHFTLVIPMAEEEEEEEKKWKWKWWAVGFGVGVMGLIFVGIIMMYRVVKQKRVGRMQKQSEKSEALNTVWVGRSRMPYATRIRTEPVIEDSYVP